jgi:hypothetical protein
MVVMMRVVDNGDHEALSVLQNGLNAKWPRPNAQCP